ncbi:MAG: hypothetical protein GY788_01545 [bacterium]|nr:hypothetical protein [bacterium]
MAASPWLLSWITERTTNDRSGVAMSSNDELEESGETETEDLRSKTLRSDDDGITLGELVELEEQEAAGDLLDAASREALDDFRMRTQEIFKDSLPKFEDALPKFEEALPKMDYSSMAAMADLSKALEEQQASLKQTYTKLDPAVFTPPPPATAEAQYEQLQLDRTLLEHIATLGGVIAQGVAQDTRRHRTIKWLMIGTLAVAIFALAVGVVSLVSR